MAGRQSVQAPLRIGTVTLGKHCGKAYVPQCKGHTPIIGACDAKDERNIETKGAPVVQMQVMQRSATEQGQFQH